jgi:hypothetical protein
MDADADSIEPASGFLGAGIAQRLGRVGVAVFPGELERG